MLPIANCLRAGGFPQCEVRLDEVRSRLGLARISLQRFTPDSDGILKPPQTSVDRPQIYHRGYRITIAAKNLTIEIHRSRRLTPALVQIRKLEEDFGIRRHRAKKTHRLGGLLRVPRLERNLGIRETERADVPCESRKSTQPPGSRALLAGCSLASRNTVVRQDTVASIHNASFRHVARRAIVAALTLAGGMTGLALAPIPVHAIGSVRQPVGIVARSTP